MMSGVARMMSGVSVEGVGNDVGGLFPTRGGLVGSPCREYSVTEPLP